MDRDGKGVTGQCLSDVIGTRKGILVFPLMYISPIPGEITNQGLHIDTFFILNVTRNGIYDIYYFCNNVRYF